MTEQCFTTSYDSPKDQEDAADIRSRTVILTFSRAVLGGMFPLDSICIGNALMEYIPISDITALGSLRGNHEWHVTLATRAVKEVLLQVEGLRVKGPHGAVREAYLRPLVPTEVFVRVLWCPAFIFQDVVYELMASLGEIVHFERSRSRVGEQAIPNLQYTAVLKGVSPSQIPDRITMDAFGEKVPLLLITKGKPRCCFLCGSCAHTQSSCPNPYCRYCHRRGHVVTNCPRKKQQQQQQNAAQHPQSDEAGQPQPAAQPAAQPEEPSIIPETPTAPLATESVESTETTASTETAKSPQPSEEMELAVERDKRKRAVTEKKEPKSQNKQSKKKKESDKESSKKKKSPKKKAGVMAAVPRAASLSLAPVSGSVELTDSDTDSEQVEESE